MDKTTTAANPLDGVVCIHTRKHAAAHTVARANAERSLYDDEFITGLER